MGHYDECRENHEKVLFDNKEPVRSLDERIKTAELILSNLKREKEDLEWPRDVHIYLNSHKDTLYEIGENLDLPEKTLETFVYSLDEVTFEGKVNKKGEFTVYKVNGVELKSPTVM